MTDTIPSEATPNNATPLEAVTSKPRRQYVPQNDFLIAHDISDTLQECADRLSMKIESVRSRASKYRADGINLKKFKGGGRGRRTDVATANKFLEELRTKRAEVETITQDDVGTVPAESIAQ